MAPSILTTIKTWFSPKIKSGNYSTRDLGSIDSAGFKTWFFGLNPGEEPENLTFPIVAKEAFEKNVITYKCVMTLANNIGDLKYCLYDKKTNKQIVQHPLLTLLTRPNPTQSQSSFLQHCVADYLLDGNLFIEKVRPSPNDAPRRLWALQPNWVQVVTGTSRIPEAYFYTAGGIESGATKRFEVDPITGDSDVMHMKSYAPIREQMMGRGLSPVRSAWRAVLTHNEGARWNYFLLKNQARPSGVLQAEGDLTVEQITVLKDQMADFYGGPRNAGRPAVLANGLKWQEMSLSPEDMAYLEGKNSVARDICLALGVPPLLLHIPGDTTYNNVEQAKLSLYEETILPKANHLVDELNRWLVPDFDPNLEIRIDYDCIPALEPRRQLKRKSIAAVCGGSFLTINEARSQMGLEPVDDGDVIIVPTMATTLEEVVEPTPAPTKPMPMAIGKPTNTEDGDKKPEQE